MAKRKTFKKRYYAKRKKSILKNRFFWFFILFLMIFSGIFYLICFYDFFQIKEIKISNLKKIESSLIREAIEDKVEKKFLFFNSESIFLCNLKEASKSLLIKFPQIAKIDLKRDFPDIITAKIEEREPVAIWSQDSNYFYIDKEGIIFNPVKDCISNKTEINKEENEEMNKEGDKEQSSIEIKEYSSFTYLKIKDLSNFIENIPLGKKVIEKKQLNQILKINSIFKKEIKIPVKIASIISARRLNIKTSEGLEIYFNTKENIDWQLIELKFLLKEKITPDKRKNLKYIDLRFEKVYIFPET